MLTDLFCHFDDRERSIFGSDNCKQIQGVLSQRGSLVTQISLQHSFRENYVLPFLNT